MIQSDTNSISSEPQRPTPGFYESVSFETYRAWPAVNNSALKWLDVTPAHYRAFVDGRIPDSDSAALTFGRALHCRLLEPTLFDERFIVAGRCGAVMKSGDRQGQPCGAPGKAVGDDGTWFCGKHSGTLPEPSQQVLSDTDAELVMGAAASVKHHKVVNLFRKQGGFECSAVAEIDGLLLKGRFDKWIPGRTGTILDVKKVRVGHAHYAAFQRSLLPASCGMSSYGYAMQAHLYCRIAEVLTGTRPRFMFVLVEDGPPFGVQVYECDSETHAIAGHDLARHIQTIKQCEASGVWPGYTNQAGQADVQPIGLPDWYVRQAQQAGVDTDE
jgi:hypothetical protein